MRTMRTLWRLNRWTWTVMVRLQPTLCLTICTGSDDGSTQTEEPAEDRTARSNKSIARSLPLTNPQYPPRSLSPTIVVAPPGELTIDVDETSSSESRDTSGGGEFSPAKAAINRRKMPQSKKAQVSKKPRQKTTKPKQPRQSKSSQSVKKAPRKRTSKAGSAKGRTIQPVVLPSPEPTVAVKSSLASNIEAKSMTERSRDDHPGCYCDLNLLADTIECGVCKGLFHGTCAGWVKAVRACLRYFDQLSKPRDGATRFHMHSLSTQGEFR